MRRPRTAFGLALFIGVLLAAALIYTTNQQTTPNPPGASKSNSPSNIEARIGPFDIYPDPTRTPGARDPDITQQNISENICNPDWSTKSIRPPAHYTNRLKIEQIGEYDDADTNPRDYEEDHLIPLELGGNPTDPRNLWPEPYETSIPDGGARFKDRVESYLHEQVCNGNVPLEEAQKEIIVDWYRVYVESIRGRSAHSRYH